MSREDSNFRTTLQAWAIPGSDTALSIRLERCAGNQCLRWTYILQSSSCLTGCLRMRSDWIVAILLCSSPGSLFSGVCFVFSGRIIAAVLVTLNAGILPKSIAWRFEEMNMFGIIQNLSWKKVSCELYAVVDVTMLQPTLASGVPSQSKSSS